MSTTTGPPTAKRWRLSDVDPDLADRVGPGLRDVSLNVRTLPVGPWPGVPPNGGLGVLVVDGVLAHTTSLSGQRTVAMAWAGDILTPPGVPPSFAGTMGWEVLESAPIAELDGRFLALACRRPEALAAVMERVGTVLARSLVSTAVSQLSRVEDRLLGVLLLVAEERGRMTPDGPTVDAFLTHERLGQLIGAARPTVSLAFTHLRARGLVTVQGRRWVLSREAAHHLADPATS